jgi:hypothetical protein
MMRIPSFAVRAVAMEPEASLRPLREYVRTMQGLNFSIEEGAARRLEQHLVSLIQSDRQTTDLRKYHSCLTVTVAPPTLRACGAGVS